jgi:hypothetical protein
LHEPFGDDGLKIADSREIVDLLSASPVGDGPGSVVIGPMDAANRMAADALLKTLEEFDERVVRPVLWARDEGGVASTIRSRCIRRWCPAEEEHEDEVVDLGRAVVTAIQDRDVAVLIETLKERDPEQVIVGVSLALAERRCAGMAETWRALREVSMVRDPTLTEVLAALL